MERLCDTFAILFGRLYRQLKVFLVEQICRFVAKTSTFFKGIQELYVEVFLIVAR
ncbi:hypothetical protein CFREI_13415 [Corynebacterium freiburgense]|nr:hypothetical protein CFREI_13415 [Corynebacterium freiburgense]